jgi:hypothetical protein
MSRNPHANETEAVLRAFSHSCEGGLGDCTAKARRTRSKEFLIKNFSNLRELGASSCGEYFFTENPE